MMSSYVSLFSRPAKLFLIPYLRLQKGKDTHKHPCDAQSIHPIHPLSQYNTICLPDLPQSHSPFSGIANYQPSPRANDPQQPLKSISAASPIVITAPLNQRISHRKQRQLQPRASAGLFNITADRSLTPGLS